MFNQFLAKRHPNDFVGLFSEPERAEKLRLCDIFLSVPLPGENLSGIFKDP